MIVVVFSLITNPAFAVYEKLSIKNSHKSILKGEKFTLYGELKDRNLKPIRSAEITIWEKDKTNQKQLGVAFTNSLGEYRVSIIAGKWDGAEKDVEIFASAGMYSAKSPTITMYVEEQDLYKSNGGTVSSSISPPKITYYDTKLSLQLTDGTSQGYVKVKPTLTYGSGNALTSDVSIYVDGTYKTKVTSNQWSSNIYAGSGSHTIKASITELTSNTNTSIKYRASSDTENYLGKITSTSKPSQTSTQTSTQTPISNNDDFQMVYAIVIIAIIAVAAGVGITLSKRKKIAPIISAQPAQVQTPSDETQFWVCPHCGSDTEYRNQKQFCSRCNIYL